MPRATAFRRTLLSLSAVALLTTGTAAAQTTTGDTAAPLMTAPRPDDQPANEPVTSPSSASGAAPSDEMRKPSPPVASLPPGALTEPQAQAMVGTELRTRDGKPAGRILDFTMAEPDGRIARVVLAPNEVLGVGAKPVSVPVTALMMDQGSPTLDIDAAELARAPEFAYGTEKTLVRKP